MVSPHGGEVDLFIGIGLIVGKGFQSDDCDIFLIRTINPENTSGGWSLVFANRIARLSFHGTWRVK